MTTIREQCLAAFKSRLNTLAPAVNVYRNRGAEVQRYPAVAMVDGGQDVLTPSAGLAIYTMRVGVVGWVSAANDDAQGPAVSALYGSIVAAVLADHTLGGVAVDVREGDMSDPSVDRSPGVAPTAAFEITFEIDFITAEKNPSALP